MINLLPQAEKRRLQKEFRLRYTVLVLVALFAVEIFAFISFIPSYLIVRGSTASLASELADKKSIAVPGGEATQNDLNSIKQEITLLKGAGTADTQPSVLMLLLLGQKPAGISISRFTYARTEAGISAQLSGNAQSPNDLILFRKLLKDDKAHIKDAKYAQNFINKKTDIDFLLTVDFK